MQRVTVTLDDALSADLDAFMRARGYGNRSEALRDLTRAGLSAAQGATGELGDGVAIIAYRYDPGERDLDRRLRDLRDAMGDAVVTTQQTTSQTGGMVEVVTLRGRLRDAQRFAARVSAERGVHYANVAVIPDAD